MLKTLIIDDNDHKIDNIRKYLKESGINSITVKKTRNQGLMELRRKESEDDPYELLVLDMMFPNYPNGQINQYAGYDVLREIKRNKWKLPVILCSNKSITDISEYINVVGIIQYDQSVLQTEEFREFIKKYKEQKIST